MTKVPTQADALNYDHTVTLRDLLLFAARHYRAILACAIFFAITALVLAELLPAKYAASVTLVPATTENSNGGAASLTSAASQFSGLASIAGIKLGTNSGEQALALATLKSRLLLNKYIEQHNLMPVLFPRDWDPKTRRWRASSISKDPTLWDADQLFRKIRIIKTGARTGVVTMTITWHNPVVAAEWADGLVALANHYLREQTISRARRRLSYLRREIPKTNVVEVRNAIYTLMQEQIKTLMIATARKQFAFRIVDPAIAPSHKSFPRPLLWTVAGALLGLLFGIFFVVIRETLHGSPGPIDSSEQSSAPPASDQPLTSAISHPGNSPR